MIINAGGFVGITACRRFCVLLRYIKMWMDSKTINSNGKLISIILITNKVRIDKNTINVVI